MTRPYHLHKSHKDTIKGQITDTKIYQFYLEFFSKKGRSPSLTEIGKRFSFSRERARQLMERLHKEGYVLKLRKHHFPYIPNILSGYGIKKGRDVQIIDLDKEKCQNVKHT